MELVEELKNLLATKVIELKMDDSGEYIVNVLRNRGQAGFIRQILRHATPRKVASLTESNAFNSLKHLLLKCMRHHGMKINVNSLSVTLSREVNSAVKTSS